MAARQAGERYNFSIKYSVKIACSSCLVRPGCFACVLSWLFLPIWLVMLVITWTLRRLITLHLKLQRVWFILWSNQIRLSRGEFTWIINVGHLGTSLYRQQPSKQSDLELKLNKSVSFREVEEDIWIIIPSPIPPSPARTAASHAALRKICSMQAKIKDNNHHPSNSTLSRVSKTCRTSL